MKCRKLVKDETTKKQNIVWFNSFGKNLNYIKQNFITGNDVSNPYILENNVPKYWKNIFLTLYISTINPYLNVSSTWLSTNCYFKKVEGQETYIPILTIPEDWGEKYNTYYIAEFEINTDSTYDSNKNYYFHNNKLSAENYSLEAEGVRNSLIQRLSIIKGELWYKASYGLPLMEKIKNKGIYDSIIINIITSHPDVINITNYESYILNHEYTFNFTVYTIYNKEIVIRYTI